MRVRENPPPFTLRLLNVFVNNKSPVSTGFCGFSLVFSVLTGFSGRKEAQPDAKKRQQRDKSQSLLE